ncbi:MAG TPA: methylmalonyl-CoA mutase family protein [Vicinamibacteria bacterium]|nr:methylmalonyl-CoA mutase family protein [Vicinamibacteria bacterium]
MARPAPPPPPRPGEEGPRAFKTASDLPRAPVYGPADVPDPATAIGEPGHFPFTRGLHPAGYRGRLWTMRQYAGFGTAAESNRRYRYLLESGTTGLSVAFDLPTQIGYDSDDPQAAGEVGRVGVAIDSLEDMETLLGEIPLDRISTSMTINATAAILLSLYVAVARRRGTPEAALSGTVQNDILKEYAARGTYIYPPAPSLRLVTDVIAYCAQHLPRWNPISISGYHIREAGATAPQEIAFTFADALEYVRAARRSGLDPDRFGERLSFFFACHSDFIEEVAKFRAARRLWARLMKERFAVTNPKAQQLRFHVQTGGVTLTAQQPDNNVVRVALEALAAVLGGCQSLHTNGKDEALALPTEASARLALRTQQVIAFESGVADTVDPLGGAYAVEAATEALEREALRLLEGIEARGGALRAIEQGEIQRAIQESAYRFQKEVESGERVIVGLNRFQEEGEETGAVLLRIDPALEREQVERLRAFRARRAPGPWKAALGVLADRARSGENLLPAIIEAVLAGATVGEVAGRLREVFGEHREALVL